MPKKYDVSRLGNTTIAEEFKAKIGGAFESLLELQDLELEDIWKAFKDTTNRVTEETVGIKKTPPCERTSRRSNESL